MSVQSPVESFMVVPVVSRTDCEAVAGLAAEIWFEHYLPIIGEEQVRYMVGRFQSADAVHEQIAQGMEYYLLKSEVPVGYFAIGPGSDGLFLSKFYVLAACRGRGAGRLALDFIEARCRSLGLGVVWLTVNRFNPAIRFYERAGFSRVAEIVTDIGNSFVMDDYRMEKRVDTARGGVDERTFRAGTGPFPDHP